MNRKEKQEAAKKERERMKTIIKGTLERAHRYALTEWPVKEDFLVHGLKHISDALENTVKGLIHEVGPQRKSMVVLAVRELVMPGENYIEELVAKAVREFAAPKPLPSSSYTPPPPMVVERVGEED